MTGQEALLERAEEHLRQALAESDPSQKDYHIRSALQAYEVDYSVFEEDG